MKSSEIRVFSLLGRSSRALFSLAKRSFRFLFLAIQLERFFAIAFRECGFACSSDGALLGVNEDSLILTMVQLLLWRMT